jgi:hypothetical protein
VKSRTDSSHQGREEFGLVLKIGNGGIFNITLTISPELSAIGRAATETKPGKTRKLITVSLCCDYLSKDGLRLCALAHSNLPVDL